MALAPSKNPALVSRLDPQAQMALTGGSFTTNLGGTTKVTATPAKVTPTLSHAQADINNKPAQNMYEAMLREQQNKAAGTYYANVGATDHDAVAQRIASLGGSGGGGITTPPANPWGGGGGGGGGGVAPPAAPTGPGGAGGDGTGDLLGQFTDMEISAALAALEAQYGMTREQLLADQTLIGSQYRLLMARLNRQRQQSAEAVTSDAVSRGIYRSGIHGAGLLEAENQSMEQMREAEANQLRQEQGIQTQLSFLDAQKAAEGAGIEAQLRREQGNYFMNAGVPMPGAWGGGGGVGGGGGLPPQGVQGPQGPWQPPAGVQGVGGAPLGGAAGVAPSPLQGMTAQWQLGTNPDAYRQYLMQGYGLA